MKWLIAVALVAALAWMLTTRSDKRRRGVRHRDDGFASGGETHDVRRADDDDRDSGAGGDDGGSGGGD